MLVNCTSLEHKTLSKNFHSPPALLWKLWIFRFEKSAIHCTNFRKQITLRLCYWIYLSKGGCSETTRIAVWHNAFANQYRFLCRFVAGNWCSLLVYRVLQSFHPEAKAIKFLMWSLFYAARCVDAAVTYHVEVVQCAAVAATTTTVILAITWIRVRKETIGPIMDAMRTTTITIITVTVAAIQIMITTTIATATSLTIITPAPADAMTPAPVTSAAT